MFIGSCAGVLQMRCKDHANHIVECEADPGIKSNELKSLAFEVC